MTMAGSSNITRQCYENEITTQDNTERWVFILFSSKSHYIFIHRSNLVAFDRRAEGTDVDCDQGGYNGSQGSAMWNVKLLGKGIVRS